jgi:PilZ domain
MERAHGTATLAGLHIDADTLALFQRSFAEYRVNVRPVTVSDAAELERRRFDTCVLPLDDSGPAVIAAIRSSRLNSHSVLYGVAVAGHDVPLDHLGVNALLEDTTEPVVLRAVERTYLLLTRHLRRYARIPLVLPVMVESEGELIRGMSRDIGAGGMAVELPVKMPAARPVKLTFHLAGTDPFTVECLSCWNVGTEVGFQFQGGPDQQKVKTWVDEYLSGL